MNFSILFWLRSSAKNKKGQSPLMIRITLPGDIIDFSSGEKVDVKLWNTDKKRVSGKSLEAERTNKYILSAEKKLNSIYCKLADQEIDFSAEMIKNIFTGKTADKVTLLSAVTDHNKAFKAQIEKESRGSEDTLAMYESLKVKITAYLKTLNRSDLFIAEVDFNFVEGLKTFLLQHGNHNGGGLSTGSTTGVLKRLNKITNNLFRRGILKSDPFMDIDLAWDKPKTEGMSENEIERLASLELKDSRFQPALDRAIVSAYSGLAHQDLSGVRKSDIITTIDGSRWIKIYRIKTGEMCNIPILPPVETVIQKYKDLPGDNVFPQMHINTYNNHLEIIGGILGLSIKLTSHKLRHSFAQMMFDSGFDIEALSKIMGHSSSSTTKAVYARSSTKMIAGEVDKFREKKFPTIKLINNQKIG